MHACCTSTYTLGLGRRLQNNIRRFAHVFINVVLILIGYRKPPKLDYCFITSTSIVPVVASTWI